MATKIEWVKGNDGSQGETWNPIIGCSIATAGCKNCYAMRMAWRLANNPKTPHYAGTVELVKGKAVWTGKMAMAPDRVLTEPLRRRKPTTYFVNSMGDLFHENVPDEWIDCVFAVMVLAPQHTFQVLTKRSARMREYLNARNGMGNADICRAINEIPANMGNRHGALLMPLPNVWLGVSAERQQEADERIPDLLATPAAVRFVSIEPMLGPVNFGAFVVEETDTVYRMLSIWYGPDGFDETGSQPERRYRIKENHGLDWIICGGESGPSARAPDDFKDSARSLRDQCQAAGVAFFFKQMPKKGPIPDDLMIREFPDG